MTAKDKLYINSYAILYMANRIKLEEIPETLTILEDGTESNYRLEVEVEKAKRTIEKLNGLPTK